ncbi:F0F1 ATP synthase subunit epsilon [Desulfomicrobium sp. ZS1]|jgi:F-type H+-transporting ATPase subunit epsilon|uniref:F0F1 ATP synthase subunit epsilon n=1 Tax=Desulfomicrobium sp. ZS1 TaxID=2952228 RepID=UPI0020B2936C|nr:F0F1 ATP synthase subunit epsilon [Desulfomicrobium sp. ZS1]UTF50178.1 F0F1 ATP synthase subunit epsilon [Desulfomicrobium sp. ZS1]
MAKTITLEIVTPDKMVLKEEVDYVGAPGINGEFGVLPNHIPFLSALGIGSLYYKLNGKKYYVFVAGGFAEVSPAKVTVLAEVAERAEDIDLERARRAQDRAEQRTKQQQEKLDHAAVQAALARALHRMKCRQNAVSEGTCRM